MQSVAGVFAERAAAKVDGITPSTPVRPLKHAAVIGAGTMGAGIAVALLDAGIPVWLVEADQPPLGKRPSKGRLWRDISSLRSPAGDASIQNPPSLQSARLFATRHHRRMGNRAQDAYGIQCWRRPDCARPRRRCG